MIRSIYLLLSLLALTLATTLRIQISPSTLLPNPHTLPSSSHATLISATSPKHSALIRRGSVFEFHNLTQPGSYLLDIYTRDYVFAPYRVDIVQQSASASASAPEGPGPVTIAGIWETYRGTRWDDRGPALLTSPDPPTQPQVAIVNAKVLSKKTFYDERPAFNPLQLLKNPMILLGAAAVGMTVIMPKMMENMDPEMKAEYEEMQKKGPVSGLTKAMQGSQGGGAGGGGLAGFDLAGWMAGAQKQMSGTTQSTGSDARSGDGIRDRRRG